MGASETNPEAQAAGAPLAGRVFEIQKGAGFSRRLFCVQSLNGDPGYGQTLVSHGYH
jgi:hypothetical protein